MDQALKARLIGAAVLVALAVLLIPELLSGRKPAAGEGSAPATSRGTRTFTIELAEGTSVPSPAPTGAAPDAAVATPAAGKPADLAAATGTDVAAPKTATPPPRPAPAVTESAQAPDAQPAPSRVARGGWAVQVGAFSSADAARKMADQLKSDGYNAFVTPVSRSGKTLQRVRVGPEAERARAEGLAASLKARGLPATVVAND